MKQPKRLTRREKQRGTMEQRMLHKSVALLDDPTEKRQPRQPRQPRDKSAKLSYIGKSK